jgi:hypothetical protein
VTDITSEPAEEREMQADAEAVPELAEEQAPTETEYIEFVGDKPYGTEFYGQGGTHTITRKQFENYHDIKTVKDLVWKRGANGRFLVPVADMSPEAAELLANDPMFRRVTL